MLAKNNAEGQKGDHERYEEGIRTLEDLRGQTRLVEIEQGEVDRNVKDSLQSAEWKRMRRNRQRNESSCTDSDRSVITNVSVRYSAATEVINEVSCMYLCVENKICGKIKICGKPYIVVAYA